MDSPQRYAHDAAVMALWAGALVGMAGILTAPIWIPAIGAGYLFTKARKAK